LSLFGKGRQLTMIRRFVLAWTALVAVALVGLFWQIGGLRSSALTIQPMSGGIYSEALVGSIKTLNPILLDDGADADASKLIFSGLTQFDTSGRLQSDLATRWTVSPDGKTYTFFLRHNVTWHDGVPFTSRDVVFTIDAIQNPDTLSPLAPSWQGVKTSAPDPYTVIFTLPKPYTPFIDETTVGLLPAHLLENTDPSMLRVAPFNQQPVGTGPFKLDSFDATNGELVLKANPTYYLGAPLLDGITLRSYDTYAQALSAYLNGQVQGVARLQPDQIAKASSTSMQLYYASVPDEVAVFFKTTAPLLQDKIVRAALAQATNRTSLINTQFGGEATPLVSPELASTTIDLSGMAHQASFNLAAARAALSADGWQVGADGIRTKDGQRLELKLVTQADSPYSGVATQLAQQWQMVGAKLDITQVSADDLQQSYIIPRNYDALLYGINVGADPDEYAFWDSSQSKDPGLNLSVYSDPVADKALESGRILSSPAERAAKYKAFVQAWVADTPAVMLYSPTYVYGVNQNVYGVSLRKLVNPSDRFTGVQDWAVNTRTVVGR
jgi:peptide/nickel transport system substrate-binding protein